MSAATENLRAAQAKAAAVRPEVGGFPVLAKVLHDAGVHTNEWHLPSGQSTYHTDLGVVVEQGSPVATGLLDLPQFDEQAVVHALRTDQAGQSTFPEFLEAIWRAGVIRFLVDLDNHEVTYEGANGENYVEDYPQA